MTIDDSSLWIISIVLGFVSSFGTGLSKLAIRKSWIMVEDQPSEGDAPRERKLSSNDYDLNSNDAFQDEYLRGSSVTEEEELQRRQSLQRRALTIRTYALLQMTVINPVLDIVAMYFCSPSIFAPFSGVALAWVVLLSGFLLGEHPEPIRIFGACLIVGGEVIVATFGDHTSDDNMTLEELHDSYLEPDFLFFLSLSTAWMFLMGYWICYAQSPFLQRVAWGVAGGFISGFQNFIKDALTVLKVSPSMKPWLLPWWFWLLCFLAATTAAGGLALLTACMKRYDATYTAGIFAGSLVLSASTMSLVHYHTWDHLSSTWSHIMYPIGLSTLLSGVFILVKFTKAEDDLMAEPDETGGKTKGPYAKVDFDSSTDLDLSESHLEEEDEFDSDDDDELEMTQTV